MYLTGRLLVKKSTALQGALMLSAEKAHALIREKTLEAIAAMKAGLRQRLSRETVDERC